MAWRAAPHHLARWHLRRWQPAVLLLLAAAHWSGPAPAQTLLERLQERRQQADNPTEADTDDMGGRPGAAGLS